MYEKSVAGQIDSDLQEAEVLEKSESIYCYCTL